MSVACVPSRHVVPERDWMGVAIASVTAVCTSGDALPESFAPLVYNHIMALATANGFKEADIIDEYRQRGRWTSVANELATEVVEFLGGPVAVLDIFDLHTFDESEEEYLQ